MDLEIQDLSADVKPKYTTRLQCYGQELARLAQEFVSFYGVISILIDVTDGFQSLKL